MTKTTNNENRIFLPSRGDGQLTTDTVKVASTPNRCTRFFARFIPACAVLSIIGGTTFLGLSLVVVAEGSVGVTSSTNDTIEPGVYLQLPWKRDRVDVVSVDGVQTLTLWNVRGRTIDDMDFDVRVVVVDYAISNVKRYVDRVRESRSLAAFNAQLSARLSQIVSQELETMHSNDIEDRPANESLSFRYGIDVDAYGVTVVSFALESTTFPMPTGRPRMQTTVRIPRRRGQAQDRNAGGVFAGNRSASS